MGFVIDGEWLKYSPNFMANLLRRYAFTGGIAPETFGKASEKLIKDIVPHTKVTVDVKSIVAVAEQVQAGKKLTQDTRSVVAQRKKEWGAYAFLWTH